MARQIPAFCVLALLNVFIRSVHAEYNDAAPFRARAITAAIPIPSLLPGGAAELLLKRQGYQCAEATDTPCPDGNGCCPSGAACTYTFISDYGSKGICAENCYGPNCPAPFTNLCCNGGEACGSDGSCTAVGGGGYSTAAGGGGGVGGGSSASVQSTPAGSGSNPFSLSLMTPSTLHSPTSAALPPLTASGGSRNSVTSTKAGGAGGSGKGGSGGSSAKTIVKTVTPSPSSQGDAAVQTAGVMAALMGIMAAVAAVAI